MWPRCTELFTAITQWGSTILMKWLYIYRLSDFVVFSHLRPLSPPNIATAAPWLMNRPPHRNAGSSGFPFTGSTKPSTTLSAPCVTALTNALFTWRKKKKARIKVRGGEVKCPAGVWAKLQLFLATWSRALSLCSLSSRLPSGRSLAACNSSFQSEAYTYT